MKIKLLIGQSKMYMHAILEIYKNKIYLLSHVKKLIMRGIHFLPIIGFFEN